MSFIVAAMDGLQMMFFNFLQDVVLQAWILVAVQ
jgi:hypothetical protein